MLEHFQDVSIFGCLTHSIFHLCQGMTLHPNGFYPTGGQGVAAGGFPTFRSIRGVIGRARM